MKIFIRFPSHMGYLLIIVVGVSKRLLHFALSLLVQKVYCKHSMREIFQIFVNMFGFDFYCDKFWYISNNK